MSLDQARFTNALLDPALTVPEGLVDPQGRPAGKRFDVYRNNVIHSLAEAMELAFPAIQKLLGAGLFRELSIDFIRKHPPLTPVLMFYGSGFAEHLATVEPLAKYPYLPDVARLEMALRESYHAADAPAIAPATLADIAPDDLLKARFTLAPSLRLLSSPYPVVALWEYNMLEDAPKPQPGAQTALITRAGFDPQVTEISADTGFFLGQLMQGKTLERILETDPDIDLGALLALLLHRKIIIKIGL